MPPASRSATLWHLFARAATTKRSHLLRDANKRPHSRVLQRPTGPDHSPGARGRANECFEQNHHPCLHHIMKDPSDRNRKRSSTVLGRSNCIDPQPAPRRRGSAVTVSAGPASQGRHLPSPRQPSPRRPVRAGGWPLEHLEQGEAAGVARSDPALLRGGVPAAPSPSSAPTAAPAPLPQRPFPCPRRPHCRARTGSRPGKVWESASPTSRTPSKFKQRKSVAATIFSRPPRRRPPAGQRRRPAPASPETGDRAESAGAGWVTKRRRPALSAPAGDSDTLRNTPGALAGVCSDWRAQEAGCARRGPAVLRLTVPCA